MNSIKNASYKINDSFDNRTISVLVSNDMVYEYSEDFCIICSDNEFDDAVSILDKIINVPSLINISFTDMYIWFTETKIWEYTNVIFKMDDDKVLNNLDQSLKGARKVFLAFQVGNEVSLKDIDKIIDKINSYCSNSRVTFGVLLNQEGNNVNLSMYVNRWTINTKN